MSNKIHIISRRQFLSSVAAIANTSFFAKIPSARDNSFPLIFKTIPKCQQNILAIGMDSWITFNVGSNVTLRKQRQAVLQHFFDRGGSVIDSSPMYGFAEDLTRAAYAYD